MAEAPDSGDVLDMSAAARLAGVTYASFRRYHERAKHNRQAGYPPAPGALPAPDYIGRTPVWTRAQLDAWLRSRPGRGAGGGRKPRSTTSS